MSKISLNSNAKINLFLDVVNKREDGYHNITSVMQEISLCDFVDIEEIKNSKGVIDINCEGEYSIPLGKDNTCYKVVELFRKITKNNIGIRINIEKKIPTEAGLAGGSTNAASVIKGLNKMWKIGFSKEELCKIGSKVGADVPFTIVGGTALCEGIGDIITQLEPFLWENILIIKPEFSISTPEIYKNIKKENYNIYRNNPILECIKSKKYEDACFSVANALEIPAIELNPEIQTMKNQLINSGAISSLMTGSGSCVYGFYNSKEDVKKAFEMFRKLYSRVYIVKTMES